MGGNQRKKSLLDLIIANLIAVFFLFWFVVCLTANPKWKLHRKILWTSRQGFVYLTTKLDDKRKYGQAF